MGKYVLGVVSLFLLALPVMAADSAWQGVLTEVQAGNLQLAVTVSEEQMPILPQTLTEAEIIQWLDSGWAVPEEPSQAPSGGNCHMIWIWCGFPDYCIICTHGSGERHCNCSEAIGEPDF